MTTPLLDCHSHSAFSPDGRDAVNEMCARAIDLGITVYGLSDHCEIDRFQEQGYQDRLTHSWNAMLEQKTKLSGRGITLLAGVEIGQALTDFPLAQEISARTPDFVLYSPHRTRGIDDFYLLDFEHEYASPASRKALLDTYYTELLEMAQTGDYDILAHLSYPLRYISHLGITLEAQADLLDEILRTLAQRGKALEINTSGLRQEGGFTMPDFDTVKRFRELGGELLSIGSDAHTVPHLGIGLETAHQVAKQAGFRYLTYFEGRTLKHLPIP